MELSCCNVSTILIAFGTFCEACSFGIVSHRHSPFQPADYWEESAAGPAFFPPPPHTNAPLKPMVPAVQDEV